MFESYFIETAGVVYVWTERARTKARIERKSRLTNIDRDYSKILVTVIGTSEYHYKPKQRKATSQIFVLL